MIELIPFTEADIEPLLGWIRSHEELLLWTASSFGYPLTREHIQQHLRDSAARGDRLIFKAVDSESGETIGHVELGAIDARNRSARVGRVLLAPAARGRGLGTAMMRATLAYAFDVLQVHRAELGVFDVNPRALACYERAGFRREGVRRESFAVPAELGGGYWSDITMSVLASEWESLRR
ncbi:MAG: GNAT family N-acetyltransferase [Thermoanaerobaculia bacterium]